MAAKILESGILTFINILVKFCIYPYIVNHVIWIALFGIQESLESSQESWSQVRNLGILPRFRITSKKIHSVGPLASGTYNQNRQLARINWSGYGRPLTTQLLLSI